MSNIKSAPGISPAMADSIIAWLDAKRDEAPPVDPNERVRVYTLQDQTIVFIGDRDCAFFEEGRDD